MAQEPTTVVTGAETPEAFLADRQRFWVGFTRFTVAVVALVVFVLIVMAITLT
jgi:hypothetical protein